MSNFQLLLLTCLLALVLLPSPVAAFGAGNIASISSIEGHNWRHGDIEDMLKTVACVKGHKWTSMMIRRVYFGNWLRDYSQAVDVGTLKGVQADTIRILVWILAFMSFGYATAEFEVTAERLGTYRPEEHIDNPKDYADNADARQYDDRLRGPVSQAELAIDLNTGMKNYIANESGGWATSLGYIKYSFARSIHFGRLFTHGPNKGNEEDLCEALRCLGQGLHCVEDFGAHTNYTELALRELGHNNVFAHVGAHSEINLRGKRVFPLVTGTFGGVDFLHSMLGEATDHITQSEVDQSELDQMDAALGNASQQMGNNRGMNDPAREASGFTDLLAKIPGTSGLAREAVDLQAASDEQARENERAAAMGGGGYGGGYSASRANDGGAPSFQAPPGSQGGPPGPGIPGVSVDPKEAMRKIYPFLVYRDKVVRTISGIVSKIPGLEKMIETISEKVTLFIMSLIAPYIKPIIAAASNGLKQGSGAVVDASAKQQYLVWDDPSCTDPTHSMLSKDHFSNILNAPSGELASIILQYVAPRVIYGWENPDVPETEILDDVSRVFHHPALRDHNNELHNKMFDVVQKWAHNRPHGAADLNRILSSESVKAGKNHKVQDLNASVKPLQSSGGGPLANFLPSGISNFGGGSRELNPSAEGGGSGGYGTPDYGTQQQQHQPPPAAFAQGDSHSYQTGYQQGYEAPFHPGQAQPYAPHGQQQGYGQQPPPPQQQQGYPPQGHAPQGGYGGYGGGYGGQHPQQGYGGGGYGGEY